MSAQEAIFLTTRLSCISMLLAATLAAEDVVIAPQEIVAGVNCSFRAEPDAFLQAEARARGDAAERVRQAERFRNAVFATTVSAPVQASSIPRRSYIDTAIFDKLEKNGVRPARLSDDYEFVRRIYLDLTGRIPTPDQIRTFVADTTPNKRDALIDRLIWTPEFTDKWMVWLGDLMQNAAVNSLRSIQIRGRNAYHAWLKDKLTRDISLRDIVWEALVGKGNNYMPETAAANWNTRSGTGGGPIQDTFDTAFSRAATQFLGVGHYDCILCHNGRGHLEGLSVWGTQANRVEAMRMAAFFSRMRLNNVTNDPSSPLVNSTDVVENATGTYDLNTTSGNRPNRTPIGSTRSLTPMWRDGKAAPARDWMGAFAGNLVGDPMFARNMANRIWRQMFNLGLVEPVDQLDPMRIDPKNVADGATPQATHPELLEEMAAHLNSLNFNLREFVRLLAKSSAYQLSSQYDPAAWKLEYLPMFARHIARRLEGEEVHDAIQVATGIEANYSIQFVDEPVRRAMQLPEPVEPRSNFAAQTFMNAFLRGNRDTVDRSQQGAILQNLNLMNDAFVTNRVKVASSVTLRGAANLTNHEEAVDQLFLLFLSRLPSPMERTRAVEHMLSAGLANRNRGIEDLAWMLINRTEFIFSY